MQVMTQNDEGCIIVMNSQSAKVRPGVCVCGGGGDEGKILMWNSQVGHVWPGGQAQRWGHPLMAVS